MKHAFFLKQGKLTDLLLCFLTLNLIAGAYDAQGQDVLSDYKISTPNFSPHSPDVAALMKHVQIPVDESTGVTGIEIPIHDIQTGTISLPVKLLYHASGIKVNEIASTIGLGWSLDAGGVIAQEILGRADWYSGQGYNPFRYTTQQVQNLVNTVLQNGPTTNYSASYWQDIRTIIEASDNKWDSMNDRYTFKAGDFSGVFRQEYPGYSGAFHTVPYSRTKITRISDGNNNTAGFTILDTKGNSYEFSQKDWSTSSGSSGPNESQTHMTWLLGKITSADGEHVVTFHYTQYPRSHSRFYMNDYLRYGCEVRGELTISGWGAAGPFGNYDLYFTGNAPDYGGHYQTLSSVNQMPRHLAEIKVNNETRVKFIYNTTDRADGSGVRLDLIEVYMDGIVNSFDLEQSYSGHSAEFSGQEVGLRMMLNRVKLSDGALGSYTFAYNPASLPPVTDFPGGSYTDGRYHEDFWGYYNGKNNTVNVPRIPYIESLYPTFRNHPRYADRNPSEEHIKACILEEMTYPTGGKTRFEYESNRTDDLELTGGLRIRKITDYTDNGEIATSREYEYSGAKSTDFLFRNTGQFMSDNVFVSLENALFYGQEVSGTFDVRYGIYKIHSRPLINLIMTNGVPIAYGIVREKHVDGQGNVSGMTEYSHNLRDYQTQYELYEEFQPPYEGKVPYQIDRGVYVPKLLSKKEYRTNGSTQAVVRQEEYIYTKYHANEKVSTGVNCYITPIFQEPAHHVLPVTVLTSIEQSFSTAYDDVTNMVVQDCKAMLEVELLSSKTVTENGVGSTESYEYDPHTLEIRTITRSTSTGGVLEERFTYPSDYSTTVYSGMNSRNILNPVVTRKIYRGSAFLQGIYTNYKDWGQGVYAPENVQSQFGTNPVETRIVYNKYDPYGNPVYVVEDNTTHTVYIWGCKGFCLVAEIRNATYDQVKTALGNVGPETLSATATPNFTQLNNLRTATALSGAQVTVYKHRPLVGPASVTDPSGRTTYYEYDAQGRLKFVKDDDQKLVEGYEYHLSNQ